jgi:predicted dinucleotide-binding enzyme
MTTISIIGTGKIGSALARVFARSDLDAMIANTRGPGSFPELAAEVAPTVRATTVDEAREADVLFLAIPFLAAGPFGASRSRWDGKIIVDVTNTLSLPNAAEVLAGRPSTEIVTDAFPGAEVVKGSTSCRPTSSPASCPPATAKRSSSSPATPAARARK